MSHAHTRPFGRPPVIHVQNTTGHADAFTCVCSPTVYFEPRGETVVVHRAFVPANGPLLSDG